MLFSRQPVVLSFHFVPLINFNFFIYSPGDWWRASFGLFPDLHVHLALTWELVLESKWRMQKALKLLRKGEDTRTGSPTKTIGL